MSDNPEEFPEPANLRFLRRLVTALTLTMIFGLVAIFTVLVMRFSTDTTIDLPASITLPAGKTATTFTQGPNWLAIVTSDNEILIYDKTGETLTQTIKITAP